MKKHTVEMIFVLSLISLIIAGTAFAQEEDFDLTQIKYVKVDEENLRNAPNGVILGQALKNTPVIILQETDDWALVQVTGWIWKPSLSNVKPDVLKGEYHALHILVETEDAAQDVLRQLKSGKKDFAELAKERSISPSAKKGGDLGYFNKGDFPAELENAILQLQVGEVSGVVKTEFGFNIFKRVE